MSQDIKSFVTITIFARTEPLAYNIWSKVSFVTIRIFARTEHLGFEETK